MPQPEPKLSTHHVASALKPTPFSEFPEFLKPIVGGAMERARKGLAEGFRGVTADGSPRPGLFTIARTGISVQPVIEAARAFLASLDRRQREIACFDIGDDTAWRSWHNMHFFLMRHGLLLHDLADGQREKALALMRETMGAAGWRNARDVMRLNEHVNELTGRADEYGEFFYWVSLFGEPSGDAPWGWQIDGHHLSVNCLILGDQIVVTPDFRGSEPVVAESGRFKGTRVFAEEEAGGLELMRDLSPEQRTMATIMDAPPREVVTIAQADNLTLEPQGIRHDDLSPEQRERLISLIAVYTGRIRDGHAGLRLGEVKRHLSETWFGWAGAHDDIGAFYYRIMSPVILIEFDHLPGIVYDNKEPSRRHVHTIVRTPNGNDYGRDLLARHYRLHDHSHPDTPHRRARG